MSKKIPIQAIYDELERLYKQGVGYIYGTAGVVCTQKVIDDSIARFPNNADMTERYGKQWLGKLVMDCSGLIVYLWRLFGLSIPHGSSSMVKQGYIVDCGPTPHPGWAALVDPTPDTPDNNHIGIVDKDCETIWECKGTKDGFVKSSIHDKRWTKYGRFKDVDYGEEVQPMPDGEKVTYRAEVVTKSGPLNMRSGPGTEYPKIGTIRKGDIVDVWMEYPNGWRYVDEDGDQGYVDGTYLMPISLPNPTPTDETDPPQIEKYTVLTRADGATITLVGEWKIS